MTRASSLLALLSLGAAWGLTMPLTKIAVSTGHKHFGLIFWQLVVIICVLAGLQALRGQPLRMRFSDLRMLLIIAVFGTILPNSLSYTAAFHLQGGVMSIVMSMIPMSALPIALLWRTESFDPVRLGGLLLGALAIVLLIAPNTSLPNSSAAPYVVLAVISTVCYGFEGNYVGRFGLRGLDPTEAVLLSSCVGLVLVTPLAITTGQFFPIWRHVGVAEAALIGASALHAIAYVGYLWLVGRSGPVFAAQISYIVTGFGVLSAMVLLQERYSPWVWAAMVLMMCGLALVQPKPHIVEKAVD